MAIGLQRRACATAILTSWLWASALAHAETPAWPVAECRDLFAAPSVASTFALKKGTLGNIDLVRACSD